jgi:penicillin amidase
MNSIAITNVNARLRKRPLLYGGVFFVLLLPVILHLIFWGLVSLKAPNYTAQIKHPFLTSQVTVIRDSEGIPHIEAGDAKSAYFALGYVIAQDRLFQMELQRRIGKGELSELFGDSLLESDKFLKTLLLKKTAEEYVNEKSHLYPEAWEQLDYFLAGANAFVEEGTFPIEFTILGVKPKPFTRVDAISFLFYMGFSFAEGIKSDSLFTILESQLKNRNVSELFPRYDQEQENVTILESQPGFPLMSKMENRSGHSKKSLTQVNRVHDSLGQNQFDTTFLSSLGSVMDHVSELKLPIEPLEGSNSWLIAPSRSKSGGAMLANDPHIALSNPGTWYEAHLKFPGYENYGYFLSVIPFPLIAHNKEKAWGLTMLEQDDVNLYAETIEAEKVLEAGKWVSLQTYEDEILYKNGNREKYLVKSSSHGPIFTEHIKGYTGRPVSLYWTHHHLKNPLLDVLYKMGKSNSFSELDQASSLIAAPGLNFSYADAKGNIAYYSVGRFPILKSGNPRKIMEGSTGENDVIGYVPSSQNPKLINPKNGIIITANNKVTSGKIPGLVSVEGNWQPADRFLRLTDVLSRQEKWSLEEMESLQVDTYSSFAPSYLEIAIPSLEKVKSVNGKKALDILKKWDFQHNPDSQGAAVYDVFYYLTLKNLLLDELGDKNFVLYGDMAEYWNAYRGLIRNTNSGFWDDLSTENVKESQADIFVKSLEDTVSYLEKNISKSPSLWLWRNLYKIKHPHPLGVIPLIGGIFNIGPMPAPGGAEVVNNLKYKLMKEDWTATSGPSKRRVIDYGRFDESVTQLPIGNSGNLGSPFYGNLVDDYNAGKHRQIHFSTESYSQGKRMVFLPSK